MELPTAESVIGRDERVQVYPTTSPPYKWICFLTIHSAGGEVFFGSGFKIHLPDVNRTAIVTSGHCTYIYVHEKHTGAYATNITVKFPGQGAIDVGPDDLYASPEYINSLSPDHDYGLILLPGAGNSDNGFGWSAIVADEELNNRLVTNCGYPVDKPLGTMWITGGEITKDTANRISYKNDTYGGQSGSPVYTWYGGYWTVIGVHSYGGPHNSAPRFTVQMIYRFLERMNGLKIKYLRSVAFPDVYVRCDGTGVTEWVSSGGGTVNCQYKPPEQWESFYICPVEVAPSSARQIGHSIFKVVIASAQFNQVFIRMDSKGMSHFDENGGGEVNCQFTAGTGESYFLRREADGIYSFRSVQFPHCYLRLDGTGVTSQNTDGGRGIVNCQYYEYPFVPELACKFHVE